MIKFISYDGAFPSLCSGTLTLEVDNRLVELVDVLCSGGNVSFECWEEHVTTGKWIVDLEGYPELQCYEKEITDLVNINVKHGCCGGCV